MTDFGEWMREMIFDFFVDGKHQITAEEFFSLDDCVFLDVRSSEEKRMLRFDLEGFREVLDIPVHEIPDRYAEIPRDRPVAIFCSGTQRASIVFGFLRGLGFDNVRILVSPIGEFASYFKPGAIRKFLGSA